ncbi:MAG: hypothetical protein HWE22_12645 [Flavobacteriales bacterium]|nr:hypothetical protein [Flavobacteriales bacterium]
MSIAGKIVKDAKEFVDRAATEQVQKFNEPSFGKGDAGTLHGARTDANGYKFLHITLFGTPNIKVVKGCNLQFESSKGTISCHSDTKDIESIYSTTLGKGITSFEIYLDESLYQSLKSPVTAVDITFPRKLFRKDSFTFTIDPSIFLKLLK